MTTLAGVSEEYSVVKGKTIFEAEARGFTIVAYDIVAPGDLIAYAFVEITREGKLVAETLRPAYSIWNIAAHVDEFAEVVEHYLSLPEDNHVV